MAHGTVKNDFMTGSATESSDSAKTSLEEKYMYLGK